MVGGVDFDQLYYESDTFLIGKDVVIEPQTHFRGCCSIGDNAKLGPGSLIENASLGDRVDVVQSVVRDARVGDDVSIGPFAHLRPAAEVGHSMDAVKDMSNYLVGVIGEKADNAPAAGGPADGAGGRADFMVVAAGAALAAGLAAGAAAETPG